MEKLISKLKEAPPRQRYAILIIIPIMLMLYIWFMMISPALDEKSRLETEISRTKDEIERLRMNLNPGMLEALRRQEEQLQEEYRKKYEELTSLVGEIPTEKDMGTLIRNIGRIARRSGVQIIQMQMNPPEKVSYVLLQEGDRKLVKEVSLPKEPQQPQQQNQQVPTQQIPQIIEGVSFLKSELKITLLGNYGSLKAFLEGLRKEGILSYPSTISITSEGDRLKAELTLYIIMKEEKS